MYYNTQRNRRKYVSQLKYTTKFASKAQIEACQGEFSHMETENGKTYEVYRLANGALVKTSTSLNSEAKKKSDSMAFFPTKEQREERKRRLEELKKLGK